MRCYLDLDNHQPRGSDELDLLCAQEATASNPSPRGHAAKILAYLLAFRQQNDWPLRVVLVSSTKMEATLPDRQLPLPFELPQRPSVTRIVPAVRRAFLDYGVYEQFRDEAESAAAALQLEESGVYMLGQLVQMSENQLLAYTFIDDRVLQSMKANLARIDLGFDMRHPPWNRRMKKIIAVSL